jgi:hypothetical protein
MRARLVITSLQCGASAKSDMALAKARWNAFNLHSNLK